LSNIVHFRPAARLPADPLGAVDIANDLQSGALSGKYRTITAMVEHADGSFQVIQSGAQDVLKLMGALQFAQMDSYLEAKAEAEPV
jgi:hypothetical protein